MIGIRHADMEYRGGEVVVLVSHQHLEQFQHLSSVVVRLAKEGIEGACWEGLSRRNAGPEMDSEVRARGRGLDETHVGFECQLHHNRCTRHEVNLLTSSDGIHIHRLGLKAGGACIGPCLCPLPSGEDDHHAGFADVDSKEVLAAEGRALHESDVVDRGGLDQRPRGLGLENNNRARTEVSAKLYANAFGKEAEPIAHEPRAQQGCATTDQNMFRGLGVHGRDGIGRYTRRQHDTGLGRERRRSCRERFLLKRNNLLGRRWHTGHRQNGAYRLFVSGVIHGWNGRHGFVRRLGWDRSG
mmetsp:Transcript_30574/g.49470  ORF Transcript_30574/g.49470 Transcript_30574/m.49470 type:complete len:298 (+) Transcript_30574:295-1188(+)